MEVRDTIYRSRLIKTMSEYLRHDGILALCSEKGMGRHVLASDLAKRHCSLGGAVYTLRMAGIDADRDCRRLRRYIGGWIEAADTGKNVLVIIEGISTMEETYCIRCARSISAVVEAGCQVLLLSEPEGDVVLEHLPICHVMGAHELILDETEYADWSVLSTGYAPEAVLYSTHGIPALVAALDGTTPSSLGSPSGPMWDRMVDNLLCDALRPTLIKEERLLRCAMVAFGSGKISELEELGIRVSHDLIEETALRAPLFGANVLNDSFGLIPCDTSLAAKVLIRCTGPNEAFLEIIIRALAQRGSLGRAAAFARVLEKRELLNELASLYPLELIDAGMTNLVEDAVRHSGPDFDMGAAREVLDYMGIGLRKSNYELKDLPVLIEPNSLEITKAQAHPVRPTLMLQLRLLRFCHAQKSCAIRAGAPEAHEYERLCTQGENSENFVTRVLACHARSLIFSLGGNAMQAFRILLFNHELREQNPESPSVLAALLQYDFEILRTLVGDGESGEDMIERTSAQSVLVQNAPVVIWQEAQLYLDLVMALSGSPLERISHMRVLSRYSQRGECTVLALSNLLLAFVSAGTKTSRQAHIHAGEAYRCAVVAKLADVVVCARIAERLALNMLGETMDASQIVLWELPPNIGVVSADVALFAELYELISIGASEKVVTESESDEEIVALSPVASLASRLKSVRPRAEFSTLVHFIMRIDTKTQEKLSELLPPAWRGNYRGAIEKKTRLASVLTLTQEVLGEPSKTSRSASQALSTPRSVLYENRSVLAREAAQKSTLATTDPTTFLEVSVMGHVRVRRDGQLILESGWRRNASRLLLAYMALKPGHVVTRSEIIDQFWPEANYQRARENLYTTLCSLRSTIGQRAKTTQFVISEQGRIWFDEALVRCDVDAVEQIARHILARNVADDELVAYGIRLEILYGNGSYLPSQDPLGKFRTRHKELAYRFTEALRVSAAAAQRLGDTKQAEWFLATLKSQNS